MSKPVLPDGKHVFLSCQADVQDQVNVIRDLLLQQNIKCWMSVDGGADNGVDGSLSGLQGAACVVCFMTQAYQDSSSAQLELERAQEADVPIIPVMMQACFTATAWLAILTAGSIWTPLYERAHLLDGIGKLIVQISFVVPGMRVAETSGETAQGGIGGGALYVGEIHAYASR